MIDWLIKLSKFSIEYQPRRATKAQVLANFIAKLTDKGNDPTRDTT